MPKRVQNYPLFHLGVPRLGSVQDCLQTAVHKDREGSPLDALDAAPPAPGPKPLPLVGNLHQVPKSLQWLHFYRWSREYGPVMHLSMAGQSLVILSTNQAAQDLLSRRSAQYSDRPRMVMSGELVTKGMHMLLRQYDAQYKLHQRMEAPLLNMKASNCYRPVQEMESRQLLFDIIEDTKAHGERGVDFHHHFERAATVSAPATSNPSKTPSASKPRGEQLYQLERNLHVGNLERGLANPGWNFSKHMRGSAEARGMSTEELAFDLGIVADAALDTSTVAMDWMVVACITAGGGERGFVAKAQADLDRVVGRDRLPTFEDRAQLPYIDAIVCEVLRWRPVVVGGVPHATKREDTYMGYRIPAGSLVMGNHYAITRDESVFGPDADAFQPERWLHNPDGSIIDHEHCTLKDLPQTGFGFGRRICTGRNIARNGLFIQAARLLWAFDVEAGVVNDLTGERRRVDDMDCTEGFVTMPKPFRASFRPRGDWVREIVQARCDTHGEDFVGMLDQAGRERRVTIGKE
ncbi:cytochrome P450 [Apiospora hydei]|uniref:Cytochrome P450 n=1 Tax=Apiospora hydei TaxID=1337664 RepID=A0ABR1WBY7_9PEZI